MRKGRGRMKEVREEGLVKAKVCIEPPYRAWLCVCVCVRERERERGKQRKRWRDTGGRGTDRDANTSYLLSAIQPSSFGSGVHWELR